MEKSSLNVSILASMAYGDAIGFLKENVKNNNTDFESFIYKYSKDISLQAEKGQWSYLTQIMLVNCKCLVDNKEKRQVSIDYRRMIEEIKLWAHYRCGAPMNYTYKLKLGKKYYEDDFYWEDKRGEAFSRIIPIVLANKNFSAAQEEVYKNIIYTNRHPQVVLTALLLLRIIYYLLNNKVIVKKELIDELKNYLINLQLSELQEFVKGQLPNQYKIKFEQEKINYLIDLDKAKDTEIYKMTSCDSKYIFITSLTNFLRLYEDYQDGSTLDKLEDKEMLFIIYGLLALTKKIELANIDKIKDFDFIVNMDNYLLKLREYEVERMFFEKADSNVDIFSLNKGAVMKHYLLNNIRIKDKRDLVNYTELIIESKSGEYKLIRQKK